jgi:hypothetical protein
MTGTAPGAPGRRPSPGPNARPRPTTEPAPSAGPTPRVEPQPAGIMTRAERRQAEKDAGRKARRTRLGQAVAALCVLAGLAAVGVVLLVRAGSGQGSGAAERTTAPVVGARLADPELATAFLAGAASDVSAVTTYDYRNLDDALNAGSAVTTGDYRRAYRAALTGALADTAKQTHAVHTFSLLQLGIGEMNPAGTQAKILVFGQQRVTDDTTGDLGSTSPVTLCATILRSGDHYLISELVEGANAGLPPGGTDLPVAAEAARTEILNLLTYRRDQFDADLQKATAGAVSPLREQIEQQSAGTKSAMIKGRYDLSGTVTAVAVERADDNSVVLLIAADSRQVGEGTAAAATQMRYEITVIRTVTGWRASAAVPVDGG